MTDPDATSKNAAATASAPAGGAANVRATGVAAPIDAVAWWQQHDQRVYQCIKIWVEQWWPPEADAINDAVGQVFGEHRASVREALTNFKERVIRLEAANNFEERFNKLANEVKRGSELPQSELLARIETLQRELDELKKIAGQPGPPGPPGELPVVRAFER